MRTILFGVSLAMLTIAGGGEAYSAAVLRAVEAYAPDVKWQAISELAADLDCDGRPDHALLGRHSGNVYVGVVLSSERKPQVLGFAVDPGIQNAICAEPAVLSVESLDYDPPEEMGSIAVAGFRRSKRCKGLRLEGGECDSIHFFWNHKTRRLEWWRR